MRKKKHPIRAYFHENENVFYIFVVLVFLLLFLLAIGPRGIDSITGFFINSPQMYVDPQIYRVLEDNDYALVIVEGDYIKEGYNINSISTFNGGFSAKVNLAQLEEILEKGVNAVYYDYPFNLLLTDSIPLIKADLANSLQKNGEYLTGKGVSACVIDTGISHHEAFENRIIQEVCFCSLPEGVNSSCCPNGLNEQYSSIGDLHGHGTHVAGIIAANGVVKGVAPEANIVAVKILNSTGGGVSSDLVKALQYCINNSERFNISVISMSLGCGLYSSNCDGMMSCDLSLLEREIDAGESKGIIFVASSGNSGSKTSLAAPSCLSNVISVGATTKSDDLSSFTNRNDFLSLLAPGSSINSLSKDGGLQSYSGTSQAAPHVSGSVLLLKQKEKNLDYNQIKTLLFNNGIVINDSSTGKYYVRINVYNSLVAMDNGSDISIPELILYEPLDQTNTTRNFNLKYYANDNNLSEVYYTLNDTTKTILNGNTTVNLLDYGTYTLKVYANDTSGNYNLSQRVIYYLQSFIPIPEVTLVSPANSAILPYTNISLNCSSNSEFELANISLYFSLNNLSLDYNRTLNVNSKSASFINNFNLRNTWLEFNVVGASSYECYISCVDVVGFSSQSYKWNFEVPPINQSSGTTAGSSDEVSGGDSTISTITPVAEDIVDSAPVISQELNFDGKGLIKEIQFTGGDVVGLILEELTENILGVELPTELIYKFFSLSGDGTFDSARLTFNVEKVWIEQNGLTNEDISLWGYDGSNWLSLETSFIGEDGDYLSFVSDIKSLTTFAISTKGDKLNNQLNLAGDEDLSSNWIWFLSILGFVLALSTIGLVIFKRKGMLDFTKFLPFKKKIVQNKVFDKYKGKSLKGDSDSEITFED